ncbi:MAG TPA: hypothetical protein VK105_20385 [Virgibacillus sp.]|nr:hypothetical protein [Virgibacillus sp.]HLR69452.1 hypothetical protein [Virgibacillus sp.]
MNGKDLKHLKELLRDICDEDLAMAIGGLFSKEIEQNKRYRGALEFYARGEHVINGNGDYGDEIDEVYDYGEVAREALKGDSNA